MQIKEGGAVEVEEIVAVTMGPETAVRALHKAVSLGADRSVHLTDPALAGSDVAATGYALAQTLSARAPTSSCSASSPTTASATRSAPSWPTTCGMPSLTQVIKIDIDGGELRVRAPGRVRLRHRQGRAARRHLRRRRDQRAALPVAEGDHGRQEEAARHASAPATSRSTPSKVGGEDSERPSAATSSRRRRRPPATIIEDEDTDETVEKIVAWLDERKLI